MLFRSLQRSEIADLTARVNELNKQVLDNQRECTNEIVAKEKELLDAISEIEVEACKPVHPEVVRQEKRSKKPPMGSDGNVEMMQMSAPEVVKVPVNNPKMISMVKKLKKDIQKDLTEKQ